MAKIVSIAAAFFICLILVIYALKLVVESDRKRDSSSEKAGTETTAATEEPSVTTAPVETTGNESSDTSSVEPESAVTTVPNEDETEEDNGRITFHINPKETVDPESVTTKDPFIIEWKG